MSTLHPSSAPSATRDGGAASAASAAASASAETAPVRAPVETPWQRIRRDFFANRTAVFGLVLLLLAVGVAVLAPWISPQNPYDIGNLDIFDSKLPPGSANADGTMTYWLGTDGQARDLMSAMFYGMRTSLIVGGVSVSAALAIGAFAVSYTHLTLPTKA